MRMAIISLCLGLLAIPTPAQEVSKNSDILIILANSPVTYSISHKKNLDLGAEANNDTLINTNDFVRESTGGTIVVRKNDYSETARALFDTAEGYYLQGEYAQARVFYLKTLELYPQNTMLMTYVGQSYKQTGDITNAATWYRKAIAQNAANYQPRWFLANVLSAQNKKKDAIRSAVTALVLNRNSREIKEVVVGMCAENGWKYADWSFGPRYSLKDDSGKIRIRYDDSDWFPYVLCKAVWTYEPGYRSVRTRESDLPPDVYEEYECLSNVIESHKNRNGIRKSGKEEINRLIAADNDGMLMEFAWFELVLRKKPYLILDQPENTINRITEYVMRHHIVR